MSSASQGPPTFDPTRYKADQRRAWASVASGWSRWWETIERAAGRVSERLVDLARIEPGDSVLDVATGIGEPAITAALRVGPSGHVLAVDQAPEMLSVARQRMAPLGLTNIEFREMDAEKLTLPEGSFDAILSRWGLMFLPHLDRVLERICRLLAPDGRFAAAVWGEAAQVPVIGIARDAIQAALEAPPPLPGTPTPFDLADPESLSQRLHRAGFAGVAAEWQTVAFEFASSEDYARFIREVAAPPPGLDELPVGRQEEVWAAVAAAARRFAAADGTVRMSNDALLVSGERSPAAAGPRDVRCPFCGGSRTRLESAFGSTLGFAQYWCEDCRTVFEYLKWDHEPDK